MGGAPRNPAPRNHLLVRIVKPSGYRCADGHSTSISTILYYRILYYTVLYYTVLYYNTIL